MLSTAEPHFHGYSLTFTAIGGTSLIKFAYISSKSRTVKLHRLLCTLFMISSLLLPAPYQHHTTCLSS